MKKFYLLALVAAMFAACATDVTEDVAIEAPETLKVSFEESSRIQLDDNKTVWTKGDLVSVFYRSDANQQWKFQGNTGDRSGTIKRVSTPEYSHTTSKMVVAYPYNENYYLNPETCNLQAFLPAEQTYLKDSYGINGNIMVSQSEYKQFVLKSVCGWLKIQLTGNGEKVQSIKLKGNNGEQVAGEIYVNTADATSILAAEMGSSSDDTQVGGTMVEDDTILAEVTLNCGEGVTLGAEPTAFYIALPPQEFSKGLTVEIEDTEGYVMEQSTDKVVTVERNHILPMASFEFINPATPSTPVPASNEIWYTATEKIEPYFDDYTTFGADVVSNVWDSETKRGIITYNGAVTEIGDSAFKYCSNLTTITIPDSVTKIGSYAFQGCNNLTSFYGKFASNDNRRLTIDGVLSAFAPAGLTSYTIPNSVTEIGATSFYNCSNLTNVNIPNSVTKIGVSAFYDCDGLTNITIPDSVTEISSSAFYHCENLTSVTIGNGVTKIGSRAFYRCIRVTNVTLGNSVASIGEWAFRNCESLTSVTIPDSVTKIGSYAFQACFNLINVTVGNAVTEIAESAFYACTSLKKVYCKPTTPPTGNSMMFGNNAAGRKFYVPTSDDDSIINAYKAAIYWSNYADYIFEYDFE